MKDVVTLRDDLSAIFAATQTGALPIEHAVVLVRISESILASVIAQIKYAEMRGEKPSISFLGVA